MTETSEKISFIRDKIIGIVSDNQNLKSAYDALSLQLESLQHQQKEKEYKIKTLEQQIIHLESEKGNLTTVNTLSDENLVRRDLSKDEINSMIKEIDECLALLNI